MQNQLLDRIRIVNNPYLGYKYEIEINQQGIVKYRNNLENRELILFMISNNKAKFIVQNLAEKLDRYNTEDKGTPIIDGYYWKIEFYDKKNLSYEIEGGAGEPVWRFCEIKEILEFVESSTQRDMGSAYMKIDTIL